MRGENSGMWQRGLSALETAAKPRSAKPKIEIQANGLPVVRCAADAPAKRMTASELLALERLELDVENWLLKMQATEVGLSGFTYPRVQGLRQV